MARRRRGKLVLSFLLTGFGAALVAVAGVLALRPRDATSAAKRADGALLRGDYANAVSELDRAIELTPPDGAAARSRLVELLTRRGDARLQALQPGLALADFQSAKELEPGNAVAWERVGRAQLALDRFDQAALQFEEAARAFPERERFFRFAAGCAHYRIAQNLLDEASTTLMPRVKTGRENDFRRALGRFATNAANAPTRRDLESAFLEPPHATALRDSAFAALVRSRAEFSRADEALAEFETSPELELAYGRVRCEMLLQAGRYYDLRRTAEILSKLPAARGDESVLRIQTALANGLHEAGIAGEAAASFASLQQLWTERAIATQATDKSGQAREMWSNATRAQLLAVEEYLRIRAPKPAKALLAWFKERPPSNLLLQFYPGFAGYLEGDRSKCIPQLELAAQLLIDGDGRHWQLRDREHGRWLTESLAEALGGCGRVELAARLLAVAIDGSEAPARLLRRRIDLLRPFKDRLEEAVKDEFALLQIDRDDGRALATWETDWIALRPKSPPFARVVLDMVARVDRVFRSAATSDPAVHQLALMAAGQPQAGVPRRALADAGSALLREIDEEPCLALQVYRALIAAGQRDQGYLLLFAVVNKLPEVADFRLLLARHDLADGRTADAAEELAQLCERAPDDLAIARLALDVAFARRDDEAVAAIVAGALRDGPTPTGRVVGALVALHRGQLDLARAATAGSNLATPAGRALAGAGALVALRLGDSATAETAATAVLAADSTERSALETLIALLAARKGADGTCEADAWIASHDDAIAALDDDSLTALSRAAFRAGANLAAEQLARRTLARAPGHAAAELALADALLAQSRWDDVDLLLAKDRPGQSKAERTRRVALVRLIRDGPDAGAAWLRSRIVSGEAEAEHARWLALLDSASGRVQAALDLLRRLELKLSEDDQRLVAAAIVGYDVHLDAKYELPGISRRAGLVGGRSVDRDRELERWLSIDFAAPGHRFLAALTQLALLADIEELAPVRAVAEERLLARHPDLGWVVRRNAEKSSAAGDDDDAARRLLQQLRADPSDIATLRQLLPILAVLDDAGLATIEATPASRALQPSEQRFLAARRSALAGDRKTAEKLLLECATDDDTHSLALLALADLEKSRVAQPDDPGLARAPWCEAAAATRDDARRGELYAAVLSIACDAHTSDALRARIVRRIERPDSNIPPAAARQLEFDLVAQPGAWFGAYDVVTAELADAGPDLEVVERIGAALQKAVEAEGSRMLPDTAIRALGRISRLARISGVAERAVPWLARAEHDGPIEPLVIAERGWIALAAGEIGEARRRFQIAQVLGAEDPELFTWLGEDALMSGGRSGDAITFGERALKLATGAAAAPVRLRAQQVVAMASYLAGATERSRTAWEAVCRELGEDPAQSLPIALETFARGSPADACKRLAPIANAPGPYAALAKRLLAIAEVKRAAPAPSKP